MSEINDYVNKAKSWLKSRTVWGGIVSIVNASLIFFFGADAGTDLNVIVDTGFEGASAIAEYADSVWAMLTQGLALVLTVWGRFKAKLPIEIFGTKGETGIVIPPKPKE